MNSFKIKGLALFLAIFMMMTFMPMVMAEATLVEDEAGLDLAAANGGEIVTGAFIDVQDPVVVEKDLTIQVGGIIQQNNDDGVYHAEALFIVKNGAKLTVDATNATIHYQGQGNAFVLQEGATLELNGGSYTAEKSLYWEGHPSALIQGESGTSVLLKNGGFGCTTENEGHYYAGTLMTGEGTLEIQGGSYHTDPTPYLAETSVSVHESDYEWRVLPIAAVYGEAFTTALNENRELVLNRYVPETEEDLWILVDALSMAYTYEKDGMEYPVFAFHGSTYDFEEKTILVSLLDENWNYTENHFVSLRFEYDEAIKTQVDALVETLPPPEYNEEWGEEIPHYYTVNDLELMNYWLTCTEENEEYNVNNLINYSKEFKEDIDYRNFRLDTRMGYGDVFVTEAAGIAEFKYGNTVYAAIELGARANHIFYVPTETADEEVLSVVQSRIDGYLGESVVTVKAAGTVGDLMPAEETGVEGLADTDLCFTATINGFVYTFAVLKDSTKIVEAPTYQSVDVSTAVMVRTEDASVPLDTMIEVEKLTEGEAYDHIMSAIQAEEHETYDIGLYSGSKEGYVTALKNGTFEVEIPLEEKFQGKDLIVYYVAEDGTVTEHEVTPLTDAVSFTTDHFSAYTLAVKETGGTCDHVYSWDAESKTYRCQCGEVYEDLDPDGDGKTTMADVVQLLRAVDGIEELPLFRADIDRDGLLDLFDPIRFLQLLNQ